MRRLEKESGADRQGEGYGPSWYDVRSLWQELEKSHELVFELRTELVISVDQKLGLRTSVWVPNGRAGVYPIGFGPAYANGPKTLPAALHLMLSDLSDQLDQGILKVYENAADDSF